MSNKAFSLIELSIVLIIIGLLVAGITGGASLIQTARNRAIINNLRGYEQAVLTFKVSKNRLPGDLNDDGKVGYFDTEVYTSESFPAPYNVEGNIPNKFSGPFVDLYLEGIIDFQPKNAGTGDTGAAVALNGGIPYFVIQKFFNYFENGLASDVETSVKYGMKENELFFTSNSSSAELLADPKIFKYIDDKLDDGVYNSGKVRSNCSSNDYITAINNKVKCTILYYRVYKI